MIQFLPENSSAYKPMKCTQVLIQQGQAAETPYFYVYTKFLMESFMLKAASDKTATQAFAKTLRKLAGNNHHLRH